MKYFLSLLKNNLQTINRLSNEATALIEQSLLFERCIHFLLEKSDSGGPIKK
jgi:hypothetical protein